MWYNFLKRLGGVLMSKYAMSDIHGHYDKFIDMIKKINFSSEDELYIIGDILDRGPMPLHILDYIVSHKNIKLLKGNHESYFEDYYLYKDLSTWYKEGGESTYTQLVMGNIFSEESIYNYIKKLPFIEVVDKFILVHAGLYFPKDYENMTIDEFISIQEEEICINTRANVDNEKKFKDYTVICGHTTVQSITDNYEDTKILHRNGTIYIDCGCFSRNSLGKLACLRLDDLKEFYI